jgi:hypothetical protein
VPKSRSRVKKSKSSKSAAHKTREQRTSADLGIGLVPERGLFAMDPRIRTRREQLAQRMARQELPGLLELADRRDLDTAEIEDALCVRLGEIMHRYDVEGGSDPARSEYLEPDRVLGALSSAVIDALGTRAEMPEALEFEPGGGLFAPWRLWELLREITPQPEAGALYEFEDALRSRFAASLPASTVRSFTIDSLRWVCDAYGSRFLITVEFERAGLTRWYAWDIDACGYEAVTVDAGAFDSSVSALESWRAAVGETAAACAALGPVDDAARWDLIASLLPQIEAYGRMGGETSAQLGEYHRARRLAQEVREGARFPGRVPAADSAREEQVRGWAEQFASRLSEREPGHAFAFDVNELAAELAETWAGEVPTQLFLTCSPHRVAAKVRAVHGFYREDFAAALQDLLPQWVRWIAQQTGLPEHLLERSLAYCDGQTHPAQAPNEREPNWYARCTE